VVFTIYIGKSRIAVFGINKKKQIINIIRYRFKLRDAKCFQLSDNATKYIENNKELE
jgi:hypothetical protein